MNIKNTSYIKIKQQNALKHTTDYIYSLYIEISSLLSPGDFVKGHSTFTLVP